MKKYISSSIGIDGFERVEINKLMDKLEKFDASIKSASLFFTKDGEQIKAIAELMITNALGKKKRIIKKAYAASAPFALKKALKKAKKKLITIVIKSAQAA